MSIHICLECGAHYDRPTLCPVNGADSPTIPVEKLDELRHQGAARIRELEAALTEIMSPPDASKGEYYGCRDLHEARQIALEALEDPEGPA